MLSIAAHNEHVPEVERYICTIKERALTTINTLPFKNYPYRSIVEMIYNTVFELNCLSTKNQAYNPHLAQEQL